MVVIVSQRCRLGRWCTHGELAVVRARCRRVRNADAMTVAEQVVVFALAAIVSLATSWVLVTRLERIGERIGLSEALLGLLAALAADTPEITSAVTALAHNQRDVGAGVVIGSNVFNLAALLGIGAIVAGRISLHRRVVVLSGAIAMWVAMVCVATIGGGFGPGVGLLLSLAVFVPYIVVLGTHRRGLDWLPLPHRTTGWISIAVDEEELELDEAFRPARGRPVDIVVAAISLVVVVAASVLMERSATSLGTHFAVPGLIVGGVVLAAVTSLPNAVAAIYLAAKGRGAAMLSTALNSNSLNVIAGLLLPAVFLGVSSPSGSSDLIGAWYVGLTAVALGFAYADRGLRRLSGWVIVFGYAGFVAALFAVT